MLERTVHPNGVVTWQSPLLRQAGVSHAFSTRIGGVSDGPYASLNLGPPLPPAAGAPADTEHNVAENYRRLQAALGCPPGMMRAWVTQVHGRRVELLEPEPESEYSETLEAEIRDRFSGQACADALVSIAPGVLLTVRVADCVPILLASEDGGTVAAVHAGWRGVVGDVVAKAVRTMREAAGEVALTAAIGPAISAEHFEVGEEVAADFYAQGLEAAVRKGGEGEPGAGKPGGGAKPHIDLQQAVRLQLERSGVARIDTHELCTFRDSEEFFSHRRDRGVTGRMAAVIAVRG